MHIHYVLSQVTLNCPSWIRWGGIISWESCGQAKIQMCVPWICNQTHSWLCHGTKLQIRGCIHIPQFSYFCMKHIVGTHQKWIHLGMLSVLIRSNSLNHLDLQSDTLLTVPWNKAADKRVYPHNTVFLFLHETHCGYSSKMSPFGYVVGTH